MTSVIAVRSGSQLKIRQCDLRRLRRLTGPTRKSSFCLHRPDPLTDAIYCFPSLKLLLRLAWSVDDKVSFIERLRWIYAHLTFNH